LLNGVKSRLDATRRYGAMALATGENAAPDGAPQAHAIARSRVQ